MEKKTGNNSITKLTAFLGEPTPSKKAGLAYSVIPILSVVVSLIFIFFAAMVGLTGEQLEEKNGYRYAVFIIPQVAIVLLLGYIFLWSKKSFKQVMQEEKCEWKYYPIAIVLQIGLIMLSQLNGLFLEFLERFGYQSENILLPDMNGLGVVGVLFVVAVLPSLFEEILFRGVLLNGIKSFGKVGAVLLCGGLFSLFHQNPAQTPYQFCCGAAYALLALRANSVYPTILAHFLNNAAIVVLIKLFGENFIFSSTVGIGIFIVSSVCLVGALSYLIFFDKKNEGKKNKTEQKNFFKYASVGIIVCVINWLSTF